MLKALGSKQAVSFHIIRLCQFDKITEISDSSGRRISIRPDYRHNKRKAVFQLITNNTEFTLLYIANPETLTMELKSDNPVPLIPQFQSSLPKEIKPAVPVQIFLLQVSESVYAKCHLLFLLRYEILLLFLSLQL